LLDELYRGENGCEEYWERETHLLNLNSLNLLNDQDNSFLSQHYGVHQIYSISDLSDFLSFPSEDDEASSQISTHGICQST